MQMGWQAVLVGAAVLFLGFLVVKMRPGSPKRGALAAEVRAARARAYAAKTPRDRSEALCEAGRAAASGARWTAAAGFFLRAMNADPTWPEGVRSTARALHRRRPRLLEKILWRRLGHVPWDAKHGPVLREGATWLVHLYQHELRDASRA